MSLTSCLATDLLACMSLLLLLLLHHALLCAIGVRSPRFPAHFCSFPSLHASLPSLLSLSHSSPSLQVDL